MNKALLFVFGLLMSSSLIAQKDVGTVIGTTTYDLQTNNSKANRLIIDHDGKMSAIWTGSTDLEGSFPDRGTFYIHYDGEYWTSTPTQRIENLRTGWGDIAFNENYEFVMSHNPTFGDYNLVFNKRNKFNGAWTTTELTNTEGIWPRIATSGNYIYAINGKTSGSENDDNLTIFHRSTDNGETWDITNLLLPGIDTLFYSLDGDAYNIKTKDSIVAVVCGTNTSNLIMWKSTDYGSTWTHTIIKDIKLPNYDPKDNSDLTDVNGDGTVDTVQTNDASIDLLIDNNGIVHASWGNFTILDNDPTTGYTYFLWSNNALEYWNEYMGTDSFITITNTYDDYNQNNSFFENFTPEFGKENDGYTLGKISTPSFSYDSTNNKIYLIYSSVVELPESEYDLEYQVPYRDLYITEITTTPSSVIFTEPKNFTNSARKGRENMYPSTADYTYDNKVHLIWQQDNAGGGAIGGGAVDYIKENEIRYLAIPTSKVKIQGIDSADISFSTEALNGNTIKFTPELEPFTGAIWFRWDFGDNLISTQEIPTHQYQSNGSYNVCLQAQNKLYDNEACESIDIYSVLVEELKEEINLTIFPNPTTDMIQVNQTIPNNAIVNIYSIDGKAYPSDIDNQIIDVSQFNDGVYILEIQTEAKVFKQVFIKE